MGKYLRVWLKLSRVSFDSFFLSRIGAILFLTGKIIRFLFFLIFLIILVNKTNALAGYNLYEVLLFFLTFNLIDSATQMLFREVYRFRHYIVSGNFDLLLVKPVNVLFRSLLGWTDLLDLITLLPLIVIIIYIAVRIPHLTVYGVLIYVSLVFNSLLIAASFHIMVISLAVITTEIDHAIMIYRDVVSMGRFPIDIYSEPLRSLVTFILPVGIMMSFPVNALLGKLNAAVALLSFAIGAGIFIISLLFWNYALKKYTSASS